MPRAASLVVAALLEKGMEQDENHDHMFRKSVDGATHLVTRTSHGAKEIGDELGKRMASQCALQLREFWELVDCTLTEDGWDKLVRERCSDGRNPFLNRG
jgi:hypothetical protein